MKYDLEYEKLKYRKRIWKRRKILRECDKEANRATTKNFLP